MPSILAAFVYLGIVVWLFRRDIREQRGVTSALWIPLLWLIIIGSRFVSQWLDMVGLHLGAANVEEGSPLDACIFGLLILSGFYVLNRRRVRLSEVVRNNRWLTVFMVYCFLAILWSDFPLVALKRWLKVLGHPIMVLVVLTEPDPEEAIIRLLKRCAYVWILVSILFIKYFPDLGRGFDAWSGEAVNNGIAINKNMLGLDVFILGVFFVWYFMHVWRSATGDERESRERRNELILIAALLFLLGWLLKLSHSSTALVSILIAVAMMVFLGLRWVNPRQIGVYLLAAVFVGVIAQAGFDIYGIFLQLLGKSPTLTDRTLVWNDLLQMKINPILGAGFESFWLGDNLKIIWAKWWWHPNQAHNAYLETYLNLGLAGLFLLIGWFIATYQKAYRDLLNDDGWGRFRLSFLVAVLFYGWTEAAFKGLDPVFFIFYLIAMDYPKPRTVASAQSDDTDCAAEEMVPEADNNHNYAQLANRRSGTKYLIKGFQYYYIRPALECSQ
jgi:exopolysaccharide production protein ExoQ